MAPVPPQSTRHAAVKGGPQVLCVRAVCSSQRDRGAPSKRTLAYVCLTCVSAQGPQSAMLVAAGYRAVPECQSCAVPSVSSLYAAVHSLKPVCLQHRTRGTGRSGRSPRGAAPQKINSPLLDGHTNVDCTTGGFTTVRGSARRLSRGRPRRRRRGSAPQAAAAPRAPGAQESPD